MPTAADLVSEIRLRRTGTDMEILTPIFQGCDWGADFVSGANNYTWWRAAGAALRPRKIAEIGTRYGYSLWSLVTGANRPPEEYELHVYDAQLDGDETLPIFEENFRKYGYNNLHISRQNTQEVDILPVVGCDLVVVDGDHSEEGAYHDCILAYWAVRNGGVILVDDTVPHGVVRRGVDRFCADFKLDFAYIPTLRGLHVITAPLHGHREHPSR